MIAVASLFPVPQSRRTPLLDVWVRVSASYWNLYFWPLFSRISTSEHFPIEISASEHFPFEIPTYKHFSLEISTFIEHFSLETSTSEHFFSRNLYFWSLL